MLYRRHVKFGLEIIAQMKEEQSIKMEKEENEDL